MRIARGDFAMSNPKQTCSRCGGVTVRGRMRTVVAGMAGGQVEFVIPGTRTSWNPVTAFRQGLAQEPADEVFSLGAMGGFLCRSCGHLDLYAWIDEGPDDLQG